jgi:thiol-disulfide isomerase/thioredoxin
MRALFNQYSYLFISLIGLLIVAAVLRWRRTRRGASAVSLIGLIVVLVIGQFALRPGFSDVNSVQAAEELLANGKPTFMEFFSNYCLGCVAAKPQVDQLVAQIQADYNILRVDIHTDFGRELRGRHQFSYTPEFILFDRAGREVWRAHVPPSGAALSLAQGETRP